MPKPVLTNLDFNNVAKAVNLTNPTAAQDAATKAYVDSAVEGLAWKDSVRVASNGANINLASPGATIDGITMVSGDRFLAKDQTTASQNGIYVWNGAASVANRSLDADTFPELEQAVVTVEEGTSAGATFRQTAVNGTLGSTNITWSSFGTSSPAASETTAGIAELATQAETDAGTDDLRIVTPLKLATWSGRVRRFATNIGDGSTTSFAITHNLNTRDVLVAVYSNSSFDEILCDVVRTSTTVATIVFASAPTTNQFRVVVFG